MTPDERKEILRDAETLRRKAAAAKSLLSRRYREMNNLRLSGDFHTYQKSVDAYNRQHEVFEAAVRTWREAHDDDKG